MPKIPIKQIRGAKDLIHDAVNAGINATEEVHQAIARKPYALLEKIDVIATPVKAVGHVQHFVTSRVYQAVRTVNKLTGIIATQVIDRIESYEDGDKK